MKIELNITEEEAKDLWHRLNAGKGMFYPAYNKFYGYNAPERDISHQLWRIVNDALMETGFSETERNRNPKPLEPVNLGGATLYPIGIDPAVVETKTTQPKRKVC